MNWIKCSERLPEKGVDVLAWDGVGQGVWFLDENGEWDQSNVGYLDELAMALRDLNPITHWMPLPEPPGE